jgi:hypothetical protein
MSMIDLMTAVFRTLIDLASWVALVHSGAIA